MDGHSFRKISKLSGYPVVIPNSEILAKLKSYMLYDNEKMRPPILPRDSVEIRHVVVALRLCKVIEGAYNPADTVAMPNGFSRADREAMKNRLKSAARSISKDETKDERRAAALQAAAEAEAEAEQQRIDAEAAAEEAITARIQAALNVRETELNQLHNVEVNQLAERITALENQLASSSKQVNTDAEDKIKTLEGTVALLNSKLNVAISASNRAKSSAQAAIDEAVRHAVMNERKKATGNMFERVNDWFTSEEATPKQLMELYKLYYAESGKYFLLT